MAHHAVERETGGPLPLNPEGEQPQFWNSRAIDEENPLVTDTAEVLGKKGLSLVTMHRLGLPVPPGFILTTDVGERYATPSFRRAIQPEIDARLARLETQTHRRLGDPGSPLVVSVRSGAPSSLPGVLVTIPNVGLCDATVEALAQDPDIGPAAAWEAYFTLVKALGTHAFGVPESELRAVRTYFLKQRGVARLTVLPVDDLWGMVSMGQAIIRKHHHKFPQDPHRQLDLAVKAVVKSWEGPRARRYRKAQQIPDTPSTAVIIEQMVFGNSKHEGAGSGVLFTRDPQRYSQEPVAVFAPHEQGTAVVSDTSPYPLTDLAHLPTLVQKPLKVFTEVLDQHYGSIPQDVEFASDGRLTWLLQTREAPLSSLARVRSLQERMVRGLPLTEALRQIRAVELQSLLEPGLDPAAVAKAVKNGRLMDTGISVTVGAKTGTLARSLAEARRTREETPVVLASLQPEVELARLPANVVAVLIENGSIGSHLARTATVVAVQRNLVILFGADVHNVRSGEVLTVDGDTGKILRGTIARSENGASSSLTPAEKLMIQNWSAEKIKNPWRYVGPETGLLAHVQKARRALEQADNSGLQSLKAHEYMVFNALFPPEMRQEYTPVEPHDEQTIRELLADALADPAYEATVRTCHVPALPAGGPWARVTSPSDIDRFFTDPRFTKYGGYQEFLKPIRQRQGRRMVLHEPTELLVGKLPKDKMNPSPRSQRQHCAWTLTATPQGVVLQIRPFSPHLRSHEPVMEEGLVNIYAVYDPTAENSLRVVDTQVGGLLKRNRRARQLADYVRETVLGQWWAGYGIPQRMAAIAEVFHDVSIAPPVFEGQARIAPDGSHWSLAFGNKVK